jgi:hypothetical protein
MLLFSSKVTQQNLYFTFRLNPDYAIARPSGRGEIKEKIFGFSQNYIWAKAHRVVFIRSTT